MLRILTVVGARPQFVKAATVSRVVAKRDDVDEVLVHTGQHYDADMSDIFFDELGIPRPQRKLGIGGGAHGMMTGRQLEAIEAVLLEEQPDCVLVYGDTNSTLAGALAAVKLHIPIAHVEAGLRSFNKRMPEEINRILTDHAASHLFVPTSTALHNLEKENLPKSAMHLVGDVMYDAALFYRERACRPDWFAEMGFSSGEFILATVHRQENTDDIDRLRSILQGLGDSGKPVVLPLHPRTKGALEKAEITLPSNIKCVPPIGYLEMVWLEMNCACVATDSGGVQKEAYFHGKPCITLRDETEWVELVDTGWNTLVSAKSEAIAAALSDPQVPERGANLYGDGDAAEKIVQTLVQTLG